MVVVVVHKIHLKFTQTNLHDQYSKINVPEMAADVQNLKLATLIISTLHHKKIVDHLEIEMN